MGANLNENVGDNPVENNGDDINELIEYFINAPEDYSIDLSSLELLDLPSQFFHASIASRLTELSIDYNQLSSIPKSMNLLQNLTSLSIMGNNLVYLPDEICELINLERLILNENAIRCLPSNIGELINLNVVSLMTNELSCLPDSFVRLTKIVELYLDENNLVDLPLGFGNFDSLKILEISMNLLICLPEDFGYARNLEILNLNTNQIMSIPDSFSKFRHLKILDLTSNNVTKLPDEFHSSSCIEKLYLESNAISNLPIWLSNLPKLQDLTLSNNTLSGVQLTYDFCASSKNLQRIEASSNDMTDLPPNFGELENLEYLHFGSTCDELERSNFQNGNWLKSLPHSFCNLKKLRKANLNENQISCLPFDFGCLVTLTWLDFGQNMLETLPDSFCLLENLEFLQLSKNILKTLPENIGALKKLSELRLDCNVLSTIPESMGDMVGLVSLDLYDNRLEILPKVLFKLKNIKRLDLDHNLFKLNLNEIPRILPGNCYPARDPAFKDNWRGKTRPDKLFQVDNIIEVEGSPSEGTDDVEEEVEWNHSALRAAMRCGASFRRTHSDSSTLEERDTEAAVTAVKTKDVDDDDWMAVTYNINTLKKQYYKTPKVESKNPDEEDWDEEIEENIKYNKTKETFNERKQHFTGNVINDFQTTLNQYPPAAQAFSKTANYQSVLYKNLATVDTVCSTNLLFHCVPGQFDDCD